MIRLKQRDIVFFSLATFAIMKILNILYFLFVFGVNAEVFDDIIQLLACVFIYATVPLLSIRIFDGLPYRVVQLIHLIISQGLICVTLVISNHLFILNEEAIQRTMISSFFLYLIMNIIIEVAEHSRIKKLNSHIMLKDKSIQIN